jgi:NADH-quinone oxidoreductase subunit A
MLLSTSQTLTFIPVVMMLLVALGFVGLVMGVTHWMGPRRKTKTKLETFECGIEVQGNARSPFSIKYFLVAILFVLFDVEVIFMYPWAVNFKQLGLLGIIEMFAFISFFLVGFFYVMKKGALKWE